MTQKSTNHERKIRYNCLFKNKNPSVYPFTFQITITHKCIQCFTLNYVLGKAKSFEILWNILFPLSEIIFYEALTYLGLLLNTNMNTVHQIFEKKKKKKCFGQGILKFLKCFSSNCFQIFLIIDQGPTMIPDDKKTEKLSAPRSRGF